MGPSGCGKSTLLNLVAGLDTPTEGEIAVAGEQLGGKDENALARMRRRHIGIVFQFFNLLEGMSVLENVTLPAIIAGTARKQAEGRARDLLDLLGLGDKARSVPGVLSGGERQRLAIARALANHPTLLLADEPTGALDSEGGLEVLELFRRLHAGGQAIMMVTHDQKVADASSPRRAPARRPGRGAVIRAGRCGHGGSRSAASRSRRTLIHLDVRRSAQAGLAPRDRGDGIIPLAALGAVAGAGLAMWGAVVAREFADGSGAVIRAAVVVSWASVGLAVTMRRPKERLGRLVSIGAGLGGAASLASSVLQAHGGGLRLSSAVVGLAQLSRAVFVAVLPIMFLHLLLCLPDGVCRVARSAIPVGYLSGAGLGLLLWTQRPAFPLWPIGIEAMLAVAVGSCSASRRYRDSQGAQRQRLQWFAWAAAVVVEIAVVAIALRLLAGWPTNAAAVAAAATTIPIPVALIMASSKTAVLQIGPLLAGTVSVLGLTTVVVTVYLLIVVGLGRVPTRQERPLLVLSMVAAAVAAGLYVPTRNRLGSFANRLAYGDKTAPDQVLRTFGNRLTRAIPLDELLLQVAESLRKTLTLSVAEVWTGSEGRLERTVSVPDAPITRLSLTHDEETVVTRAGVSGPAWMAVWMPQLLEGRLDASIRLTPICHGGRLLGLIVAVRPHDGDAFSADDDTAMAELARQLGLALHNVELDSALQLSLEEVKRQADELRASRSRIVAASDAARREIERNLHDGAQQHLVALAVNIRLARQLSDVDPVGVKEVLEQLSHDIGDAVQQLRDLAHGIYPPLLMDRGLREALQAAAGRAALPTDVVIDDISRYRPEVEAAVYFCCLEALQNASKHAGDGAKARIRVWEEADGLLFEVADDGSGFDPASQAASGAGFVNMADRVGAIGGAFSFFSAVGKGTRISGRIPLTGVAREDKS